MISPDVEFYDPDVVPYDKLDSNMKTLVRVLNEYEGIKTTGCCGGHEDNGMHQAPEGSFYVVMDAQITTKEARHSLAFVAYALECWPDGIAHIELTGYKPWIGIPSRSLGYAVVGEGDPEELAEFLVYAKETYYKTVAECPNGIKPWGLQAKEYEEDEL